MSPMLGRPTARTVRGASRRWSARACCDRGHRRWRHASRSMECRVRMSAAAAGDRDGSLVRSSGKSGCFDRTRRNDNEKHVCREFELLPSHRPGHRQDALRRFAGCEQRGSEVETSRRSNVEENQGENNGEAQRRRGGQNGGKRDAENQDARTIRDGARDRQKNPLESGDGRGTFTAGPCCVRKAAAPPARAAACSAAGRRARARASAAPPA